MQGLPSMPDRSHSVRSKNRWWIWYKRRCLVAIGVGLISVLSFLPSPLSAAVSRSEQAIALARQGDFAPALEILEEEYRAAPANQSLFYDYLTVLSWAGRDGEVFPLIPRVDLDQAPDYVLEAAAKSLRNLGVMDWALVIYEQGRKRFPENLSFKIGWLYSLVGAGRLEQAGDFGRELEKNYPAETDVQYALAYLDEARRDYLAALVRYQKILERHPDASRAAKGQILALENIGAPFLAEETADRLQVTLSDVERLRLRTMQGALKVRWGTFGTEEDALRFRETDEALQLLGENLQRVRAHLPEQRDLELRTRFDQLTAYRDRGRMEEAAAAYHALRDDDAILPIYALEAAGDAFLYLEHPEQAWDIYRQVLSEQPVFFEAQLGLFYAYIESEDFDNAYQVIEQAVLQQPVWLWPAGNAAGQPNPYRLAGELVAAAGLAYGENYAEAETRVTAMHRQAPANRDILAELGNVYRDRGWPRRAMKTYELGLALQPGHLGLRSGQAGNLLDLYAFRQAEQKIDSLYDVFPEHKAVRRLNHLWDVHNMRELRISANAGWSSGSTFGSQDLSIAGTLFSRPIDYNYRGFVSSYLSQADFPEGDKTWQRYGTGVEFRNTSFEGIGELTWSASGGRKIGGLLSGTWFIDDLWALPFSVEAFSRDTPLRALKNDVRADAASIGLIYRPNELRNITLNAQAMDFNDGNFRYRLHAGLYQRLITQPHYRLNGYLDFDTSGNSRSDTPYFSPEQDAAASLTLENDWLLWRRYDRSFRHRLALSTGGYWQQDFGSDFIGSVRYEHVWEYFPRFSLLYGASWGHGIYDGDGENRTAVHMQLNWRF